MMYDGWRKIVIVWLDGKEEIIEALGRPDPYVDRNGVLNIKIDYDNNFRLIPLTSIREWKEKKY